MPSGFFVADALLLLDKFLEEGLLVPTSEDTKATLALAEAKRIKKLMGSLRHLFRNSFLSTTVLAGQALKSTPRCYIN